MKIIEITISAKGESTVETQGFVGSECREASRFIEQALGKADTETLKPEFYNTVANENKIENTN